MNTRLLPVFMVGLVAFTQATTVTFQKGVNNYTGVMDKSFLDYVERHHPDCPNENLLVMEQ